MTTVRCEKNPIITPAWVKPLRDDFEVIGVFNTAVTRYKDEVILLLRVAERPLKNDKNNTYAPIYDFTTQQIELKPFANNNPSNDFSDPRLIVTDEGTYLTSISHLRLARSKNGIDFEIETTAAISAQNEYETFGIEDPRITRIDDTYYINYVAVSPAGVVTYLAKTTDFQEYHRCGTMFCPDNKDVVIFPEKINDSYWAIHRPASGLFKTNDMWIARSDDLLCWGDHRYLMAQSNTGWDNSRIGAGAVPFRTDAGWIEIYHGANKQNRYCLGAVLLDIDQPWKVLAKSSKPIFEPQTDYECGGFFGNVVFTCGALCENNQAKLYYGAADTTVCYAQIAMDDILTNLKA